MNRHQLIHRPALVEDEEDREWKREWGITQLRTQEVGSIPVNSGSVVLGGVELLHVCKPIRVRPGTATALATFSLSEPGTVLTFGVRFVDDLPSRIRWRKTAALTDDARWIGAVDGELRKELRRIARASDLGPEEYLAIEAAESVAQVDLEDGELLAVRVGERLSPETDLWLAIDEAGVVIGAVMDMAGDDL